MKTILLLICCITLQHCFANDTLKTKQKLPWQLHIYAAPEYKKVLSSANDYYIMNSRGYVVNNTLGYFAGVRVSKCFTKRIGFDIGLSFTQSVYNNKKTYSSYFVTDGTLYQTNTSRTQILEIPLRITLNPIATSKFNLYFNFGISSVFTLRNKYVFKTNDTNVALLNNTNNVKWYIGKNRAEVYYMLIAGIGANFVLNPKWNIGIELNARKPYYPKYMPLTKWEELFVNSPVGASVPTVK